MDEGLCLRTRVCGRGILARSALRPASRLLRSRAPRPGGWQVIMVRHRRRREGAKQKTPAPHQGETGAFI